MKILCVGGEYYSDILNSLIDSANKTLNAKYKKIRIKSFNIIKVPGIFEIPVVIAKNIKKYDAFIAFGCVIKGETQHFDLISQSVTNAIMDLSITYKKPIGNGIITCFNKDQAYKRVDKKGEEAVKAIIEVLQSK